MNNILTISQAGVSIALIILILMQAKGVGLGKAWGGSGEFYKNRRGVEKIVFRATIVTASFFLILSLLSIAFS